MKLSVIVTLKKEVLDPQGKVIQQTINNMNLAEISDVRQGKYFELEIDEKNHDKANEKVNEICKKLLANLVIEDFRILKN